MILTQRRLGHTFRHVHGTPLAHGEGDNACNTNANVRILRQERLMDTFRRGCAGPLPLGCVEMFEKTIKR